MEPSTLSMTPDTSHERYRHSIAVLPSRTLPIPVTQFLGGIPAISRGASYFDIGADWVRLVGEGIDLWDLSVGFRNAIAESGDRVLLSVPKGWMW